MRRIIFHASKRNSSCHVLPCITFLLIFFIIYQNLSENTETIYILRKVVETDETEKEWLCQKQIVYTKIARNTEISRRELLLLTTMTKIGGKILVEDNRYILQQMREEFPTIMANVHYKVLKKKWSNLLQQYKELKNPVHGDKNNVDDVSWPFYNAIDEVLGYDRGSTPIGDEYIDPHEFLCVSVTPEEPTLSVDALPAQSDPEIDRRINDSFPEQRLRALSANCTIEIQKVRPSGVNRQINKNSAKRRRTTRNVAVAMPRLPRATELTIEKVTSETDCTKDLARLRGRGVALTQQDKERLERNEDEGMPRKLRKSRMAAPYCGDRDSRTDHRIDQIFEYIKRRDEENRSIMVRVMHAVESIANKL